MKYWIKRIHVCLLPIRAGATLCLLLVLLPLMASPAQPASPALEPISLTELSDGTFSQPVHFDLTRATTQSGEVNYGAAQSRWWKYTPTSSYSITVSVTGWTGNVAWCLTTAMGSCNVSTSANNGTGTYGLTGGTTYYLRLTPNGTLKGSFMFSRGAIVNTELATNNDFANAANIVEIAPGAASQPLKVDLTNATVQGGEAGVPNGMTRTAWWKYRPTTNQTINVMTSGFTSNIASCITTEFGSCSIASNMNNGMYAYSLTADTDYYIRLNPNSGNFGVLVLARAANDNDRFAGATPIAEASAGATTGSLSIDLTNATIDAGEVAYGQSKSQWWSYSATANQVINITTATASYGALNLCVTIAIGSCSVGSAGNTGTHAFNLNGGTTYYIRVSPGSADLGTFNIRRQASDNDAFANATPIPALNPGGQSVTTAVDLVQATVQPGEANYGPLRSRWWTYTPTQSQVLNIWLSIPGDQPLFYCMTESIGNCSVSSNNAHSSRHVFSVTGGTTYYLRLSGTGSDRGTFTLTRPSSDNDQLANAVPFTELTPGVSSPTVSVDTTNATLEPGEVNVGDQKSLWWSYTPSTSYTLNVSTAAVEWSLVHCVTTSIGSCNVGWAVNSGGYAYALTGGTTYFIRLSPNRTDTGSFFLSRPMENNDLIANAITIPELAPGTNSGGIGIDVARATIEVGEVTGVGEARSRWWQYTPTSSHVLNISTTSPDRGIAHCLTTAIGSCSVGWNGNNGTSAYSLSAGTAYYIRISASGWDVGSMLLSRPGNDNDQFANATLIPELSSNASSGYIPIDTTLATVEPGETAVGDPKSKWWKYTPTSNYLISVFSMSGDRHLAHCVTTAISSCSVGWSGNNGTYSYALTADTTYYLRISSAGVDRGMFSVSRGSVVDSYVAPNDNFANAEVIPELAPGTSTGAVVVNATNASVESGEVNAGGTKSLWWSYTPTANQTVNFNLTPNTGNLSYCLATSLSSCINQSNGSGDFYSALVAGTTYYFRVGNFATSTGLFDLRRAGIDNDEMANAVNLDELAPGTFTGQIAIDATHATAQVGEVYHGASKSVWWKFTSTSSYEVNVVSSAYNGQLAQCLTTALGSCTAGSEGGGTKTYSVNGGTTYYLRMSMFVSGRGTFAIFRGGVGNDHIADAQSISELAPGTTTPAIGVDLTNATVQIGENIASGRSRWWTYTATTSHVLNLGNAVPTGQLSFCLSTNTTSCNVGTGSTGNYAFNLSAGTTYYLRYNTFVSTKGSFRLFRGGVGNDDMANATVIPEINLQSQSPTYVVNANSAAGEVGEVAYGSSRAVWWSYTPSSTYRVAINMTTDGGNIGHCITTAIGSCTIANNVGRGSFNYTVTGGVTHYFRMSAYMLSTGAFSLGRGGDSNDDFANATNLGELTQTSSIGPLAVDVATATGEAGEVNFASPRSSWWKFTVNTPTNLSLGVNGYLAPLAHCVTTTIGSCSVGSGTSGLFIYPINADTTYFIRMTGYQSNTGYFTLALADSGTDAFATAGSVTQHDVIAPSVGSVFDGSNSGIQKSFNNGSTSTLSANWSGFSDSGTGIGLFEYSIGTAPGNGSVAGWTSNGASTAITRSDLNLNTSDTYYFSVRAIDEANNVSSTVTSAGQKVLPSLSFTVGGVSAGLSCGDFTTTRGSSASTADMGRLVPGGLPEISGHALSVSTNANNGYSIRLKSTSLSTPSMAASIASVSNNAVPVAWPAAGQAAFGYATSSSTLTGDATRFRTGLWAAPQIGGDVLHGSSASAGPGSACVALGAAVAETTPSGQYSAVVTYSVIPLF